MRAITGAMNGGQADAEGQPPVAPADVVRARVLCVDDNPQVLRLLGRQLGDHYDVAIAPTAQDALAQLATGEAFDVVISDLRMPDLNGLTFLKMARELYPATERIILTGLPDPATMAEARTTSGADQLIVKPWTRSDLMHAVETAVARRRSALAGE